MTTESQPLRRRVIAGAVLVTLLAESIGPAYAISTGYAGLLTQVPGMYTAPPDVNVMFTLDDSGSMQSDVIPDIGTGTNFEEIPSTSASRYLNNAKYANMWGTNSGYLNIEYYRKSGGTAKKNNVGRFVRSSAGNPLYYNPLNRYDPWPTTAGDPATMLAAADPTAVILDPETPTITLDANERRTINLTTRVGAAGGEDKGFWPATFYVYKGPAMDPWPQNVNNLPSYFDKYELTNSDATTTPLPVKGERRTDCKAATCTRVEELQNFANWLQYYRNRRLMAKGGVASAFAQQGSNLRVGFAMIGKGTKVQRGVRAFTGADRTDFFKRLYETSSSDSTTPLRAAVDAVGKHFQDAGPWLNDPTDAKSAELSCRRSFHILSTDGYWNDGDLGGTVGANNDNFTDKYTPPKPGETLGTKFTASTDLTNGNPFTVHPFADAYGGKLSDIAAYYWKTDLRPDTPNRVSPSTRDPAYWQHLSTFTVGLGVTGTGRVARTSDGARTLNGKPLLATQANIDELIATRTQLTWTQAVSDTDTTGDDLIHAAMVGRGRTFSADNPRDLANNLSAALAEAVDQPLELAAVSTESGYVSAGGELYQSTFNPRGWYGRLYAFRQRADGTVDNDPSVTGDLNTSQIWEASLAMPLPADRKIFTSRGEPGTATTFTWTALSSAQQTALENNQDILNFLRGDSSKELAKTNGVFRDRPRYQLGAVTGGVLGDIINGTPVKGPDGGGNYQELPAGDARTQYETYRSGPVLTSMRQTLFAAANDGMLHAFNTNNGVERFAYVPNAVYSVKRSVSLTGTENKLAMLSKPNYAHRYTVDGPPNVGDAYFTNGWRTMLVGSNGAGARGIFALDVSQTETTGVNAFGTSKILWEFTDDTPRGASTADENGGADMGFVLSYPHIARMRNGKFAAIFGNGYDSASGRAKLFIVDVETRAILKTFTVGPVGNNGLGQPNFVVNSQREVMGIYAGDLKGNLWKFNVSSPDPANWAVAFNSGTGTNAAPATVPLFRAINRDNRYQPITVMPELSSGPANEGVMVLFGTGKIFEDSDGKATAPANDTTASEAGNRNLLTQSIYGVWDKGSYSDSSMVDGSAVTMTSATRATVLAGVTGLTIPGGNAKLGRSPATNFNSTTNRGWFIDLPTLGERVNIAPQMVGATLFVATNTPITGDPCANGGTSMMYALNPETGSAWDYATFDTNNDNKVSKDDDATYNVFFGRAGIRTRSAFQFPPTMLTPPASANAVSALGLNDITPTYRGQPNALQGGVKLDPTRDNPCLQKSTSLTMSTGMWDTSIETNTVGIGKICAGGNKRISWRQLK